MIEILLIIAPLFLIIFATAIVQKIKGVPDSWESTLNSFALNVGLPALIFTALANTRFTFLEELPLLITNSALIIGSFVVAFIVGKLLKFKPSTFRTIFICLGFSNTAYLGIPVLTQTQGEAVLPAASLIVAVYVFWMFTIGLGMLSYTQLKSKKDVVVKVLKNLVKNPQLIAVALGLIVSGLHFQIPDIVNNAMSMLAASVTPMVLIVIGLFIGKSKFGNIKKWIPILIFSAFTLIAFPGALYLATHYFNLTGEIFKISIIDAAMPLAITPFALADQFNLDKNFIARSIVLSTILSVITIPFWTALM
jgi:predicted permease